MNKVWAFMKGKAFYFALGIGLIAFVALISVYSYKTNVDSLNAEKEVDLNEPASEMAETDEADGETAASEDLAGASDAEQADADTGETGSERADADDNLTFQDDVDAVDDADEDSSDILSADNSDASQADESAATEDDIFYPAEEDGETVDVISGSASPDTENEIVAGLEYNGEQTLIWPVTGDVILPYSMETTVFYKTLMSYKCNPGMLIAGEVGTSVQSAYEGVVEKIEANNEYGTMVTVNMGNGYKAIYGQLQNVTVSEGDTVSTASKIGEISTPTSYYTVEGPHLFFKITKDDTPVNPVNYMQ